jgi:hypothetical protein
VSRRCGCYQEASTAKLVLAMQSPLVGSKGVVGAECSEAPPLKAQALERRHAHGGLADRGTVADPPCCSTSHLVAVKQAEGRAGIMGVGGRATAAFLRGEGVRLETVEGVVLDGQPPARGRAELQVLQLASFLGVIVAPPAGHTGVLLLQQPGHIWVLRRAGGTVSAARASVSVLSGAPHVAHLMCNSRPRW